MVIDGHDFSRKSVGPARLNGWVGESVEDLHERLRCETHRGGEGRLVHRTPRCFLLLRSWDAVGTSSSSKFQAYLCHHKRDCKVYQLCPQCGRFKSETRTGAKPEPPWVSLRTPAALGGQECPKSQHSSHTDAHSHMHSSLASSSSPYGCRLSIGAPTSQWRGSGSAFWVLRVLLPC